MILVTCPACSGTMHVPFQYAGQSGPCQQCGQTLHVPHEHNPAFSPIPETLNESPAARYTQRKVVVPRLDNWFTSLGWLAVIASSPLAGLQIWYGLLPIMAVFTLAGVYDLSLQKLGKKNLMKSGLGLFFLWPFTYPAYLLKRHDFDGRTLVMLTVLFGGMWILGIVFVDSWAEWNAWVSSAEASGG